MIECITIAFDNCTIINQSELLGKMFMTIGWVSLMHRDRLGSYFLSSKDTYIYIYEANLLCAPTGSGFSISKSIICSSALLAVTSFQ